MRSVHLIDLDIIAIPQGCTNVSVARSTCPAFWPKHGAAFIYTI